MSLMVEGENLVSSRKLKENLRRMVKENKWFCPFCGSEVLQIVERENFKMVVFRCRFAMTVDKDIEAKEFGEKSLENFEEFRRRLEEWIKTPLI